VGEGRSEGGGGIVPLSGRINALKKEVNIFKTISFIF
jgi:hypothetical protein